MSTTTDLETRARHSRSAADVIGAHALRQVTAYTARADRAAAVESSTESAHRDCAAYWACTAREAGATEQQIIDAETAAAQATP